MERFYGSFEYLLDAKGRIILPARLRGPFETKRALVTGYLDRCLAIWTPEQFNQHLLAKAEAIEGHGSEGRDLARIISALSNEVEIDGQWRLTIPSNLRDYAGLEPEKPVMVIGALNRVELWQADLWARRMAPSLESLANGTSPLFSEQPAPSVPGGGLTGSGGPS